MPRPKLYPISTSPPGSRSEMEPGLCPGVRMALASNPHIGASDVPASPSETESSQITSLRSAVDQGRSAPEILQAVVPIRPPTTASPPNKDVGRRDLGISWPE